MHTPAWALTKPPENVLKERRGVLSRLGSVLIPQNEWHLPGPVNWRLVWVNDRTVRIDAWDVSRPLRPALSVAYRGDLPLQVDVYDYAARKVSTHTYETGVGHNARDGAAWAYEPEVWHWEARPVYPFHWHVFVLREVA